ncbi:DUF3017 domain-containing protein [Streptomyces sp. NPDC048142]|uniref:DUF3017 domain-containing protein n=1 Tax=Streptomyces sp. NPDC048142 TaxID=3365501 RepID=UPI003718BB69
MGAGTSPADPGPAAAGRAAGEPDRQGGQDGSGVPGPATDGGTVPATDGGRAGPAGRDAGPAGRDAGPAARDAEPAGRDAEPAGRDAGPAARDAEPAARDAASGGRLRRSRRFPRFTRDTARPEGGGRAASGDAPAPARQWPLLTVLCAAGLGLLIVALDPFDQAFRIGTILIGGALIAGAVLRWVVPSVGMLAVRSRFTDLVTYGLMGTLIVLLALVAQPAPWLDVPILEDAVRFTIR